jgi:hypothetical protein
VSPRRNTHGQKRPSPRQDQVRELNIMNFEACVKAFKAECSYQRFCQHPDCKNPGTWKWQAHHVVQVKHIKEYTEEPHILYDPRNALRLCNDLSGSNCHGNHHGGGDKRVPLSALRDENFEYAAELLGAGVAYEYLRRGYRGEDPRLQALLDGWEASRKGVT